MEQSHWLNPCPEDFKRIGRDLPGDKRRNGSRVRLLAIGEGIVERVPQPFLDHRLTVQRQRVAKVELEKSQIVQPEDVVGVFMRINNRMDDPDSLAEQLEAEIGRSVDQQIPLGQP